MNNALARVQAVWNDVPAPARNVVVRSLKTAVAAMAGVTIVGVDSMKAAAVVFGTTLVTALWNGALELARS